MPHDSVFYAVAIWFCVSSFGILFSASRGSHFVQIYFGKINAIEIEISDTGEPVEP